MRSLLVSSVIATLAVCKVTCDAFHVPPRLEHRTGTSLKGSVSTTGEGLEELRKVQIVNGGVVGDARYEDGEALLQDIFVSLIIIHIMIHDDPSFRVSCLRSFVRGRTYAWSNILLCEIQQCST